MLGAYDDALDTFGVHGVGGTLGALVTGLFANADANANLKTHLASLVGNGLWLEQLKAMVITVALSVIGTTVIGRGLEPPPVRGTLPAVDDVALFWIGYVALAVVCTLVELVRPARQIRYLKAVPLDLVALAVYQLAVFPVASMVTDPVFEYLPVLSTVAWVWLPIRVVVFYLAADLGSYWMHRLMHTRHLWRVHRWHHSSPRLYWLSGVRTTIPQQILFNLPIVVAAPILFGIPHWLFLAMLIETVVRNNWMHMNVSWRSRWLEYVFVTPRYHQIHHSADAALHDGNYGSLFSIWDRLFGSYLDPDQTLPKAFGTGERKNDTLLMMIGI
jgi:sterol desaturase/sphingolipid hydroxylase (fatty acid hydroxylase superfamily)